MGPGRWLRTLIGGSPDGQDAAEPAIDPLVVIGISDATGGSGYSSGGDDGWTFAVHLIVWRQDCGIPVQSVLRLKKPLPSQVALQRWMDEFPTGRGVKVRLAAPPEPQGNRYIAELADYLGAVDDAELAALAEPKLRPPPFEHPRLGKFSPMPAMPDLFDGKAQWHGRTVGLTLESDGGGKLDHCAASFERLLTDETTWQAEVEDRIYETLFETWEDNWRHEDGAVLDRAAWLARMRLLSIWVSSDGTISFEFDDGDLFWGDHISASGSLDTGIDHASI